MPVKRRLDKRRPQSDGTLFRLLSDLPAEPGDNPFVREFTSDADLRDAWEVHREFIVAQWIKEHPGSRPGHWWKYSAPEPRRRLGGIGTPKDEAFNIVPSYQFGIPASWVNQYEVALYSGRVVGIAGKPIIERGDFAGVPPDPTDPPHFESEASYLCRLGLLLPGEAARLTPEDFEPVELVEVEQVPEGQNPYRPADG